MRAASFIDFVRYFRDSHLIADTFSSRTRLASKHKYLDNHKSEERREVATGVRVVTVESSKPERFIHQKIEFILWVFCLFTPFYLSLCIWEWADHVEAQTTSKRKFGKLPGSTPSFCRKIFCASSTHTHLQSFRAQKRLSALAIIQRLYQQTIIG